MTSKGFSVNDLDTSVKPSENFFKFAVGGWLKANPIPAEYSRWGTFELLVEDNYEAIRFILEHPEEYGGTELEPLAKKAHQFYTTAMDEEVIESRGYEPIRHELERVRRIATKQELAREVAYQHLHSGSPLFGFYATPDAKNSAFTIVGLGQGGLGLPDRDYYLVDEARYEETRRRYRTHLTTMFTLVGYSESEAATHADSVFAIEKMLAEFSTSREELREPEKNYHKMSLDELVAISSVFDWRVYFETIGLPTPTEIDVGQVTFFSKLSTVINAHSLEAWRAYLEWNVIRSLAGTLSSAFVNERFAFYGTFLSGQEKLKPRWKRIVDAANGSLGQLVGRLYVAKHFSPTAKAHALQLVDRLLGVMEKRIARLTWMSESTKQEAFKKLKAIKVKIGYPDHWIDYVTLEVKSDSYTANVMRGHEFEFKRQLGKINKPTDPFEWLMEPQDVNAYYDQQRNEIVFPAAILQPPFFSDSADDALNYGAIGGVIGHEITHGFDDQGRKYDASGNLHDWWTPEDAERFHVQSRKLVEQYNAYTIEGGLHVNGEFTLGENIADLGGLSIAYEALHEKLQDAPYNEIDGFTPAERFFLSWAQSWKQNVRPELAKLYIVVDPHSPPEWRVNGPMSNVAAFFETFKVLPTSPLYRPPESRATIW